MEKIKEMIKKGREKKKSVKLEMREKFLVY